jgi:hypothetical protein
VFAAHVQLQDASFRSCLFLCLHVFWCLQSLACRLVCCGVEDDVLTVPAGRLSCWAHHCTLYTTVHMCFDMLLTDQSVLCLMLVPNRVLHVRKMVTCNM